MEMNTSMHGDVLLSIREPDQEPDMEPDNQIAINMVLFGQDTSLLSTAALSSSASRDTKGQTKGFVSDFSI
jgi:hypothetical protein